MLRRLLRNRIGAGAIRFCRISSRAPYGLAVATHPFAAPCQPFLYAQATSGNGFIQITPQAGTVGDAISGPNGNGSVPLSDANLFLVRDSSTMQIEQISKVQGAAQTSSAELNLDTSGTSSGGAIANAQADNDPATVSNQYSSVQPFQSATPVLSEFGNGNNGNGNGNGGGNGSNGGGNGNGNNGNGNGNGGGNGSNGKGNGKGNS